MSVRKRIWNTPSGQAKEGWQADYVDGLGKRRRKMFTKKKEADASLAGAKVEVRDGLHVPDTATITIEKAGPEARERTIPLPSVLVNTLREWKQVCPKGDLGLAFPNGAGKPESHANIINRGLIN